MVLDFIDTPVDNSWANEMMVGLTAPDGTCLQYGGYNLTLGCPSAGLWPGGWSTSTAGTYTATAVFAEPISGVGEWTITIMNSWASSVGASYDTDITFNGLCEGLPGVPGCTDRACITMQPPQKTMARASTPAVLAAPTTTTGPSATIDDGSCDLTSCYGCTDSAACNYNADATNDDGSCEYASCACPGDLDGDGQVSVADVLLFLSDFGCVDAPCVGDATGDGLTNVDDLLLMLSHFGDICE